MINWIKTRCCTAAAVGVTAVLLNNGGVFAQATNAPDAPVAVVAAQDVRTVVREAFQKTHDGWSSDEVLIRDELNAEFIAECRRTLPDIDERILNWTMLNLRKAKQLAATVSKRKHRDHEPHRHAVEIAARSLEDKYQQNIDRVLCDPQLRREFDDSATKLAPTTSTYLLRKAALGLRKARRLRPELVVRVADWNRQVSTYSLNELQGNPELVGQQPGIYLFLDKSGYLYIGEAVNLRRRLETHLAESDRESLRNYLVNQGVAADEIIVEIHAFDSKSKARMASMRRAYESELIASRKPRFNVRP